MEAALDDAPLLSRLDGDRELLRKVVQLFLTDYRSTLRRLGHALACRDGDALFSAAHSLKGTATVLGEQRAVLAAEQIERCCRAGTPQAAADSVGTLAEAIEALAERLRATAGRAPN